MHANVVRAARRFIAPIMSSATGAAVPVRSPALRLELLDRQVTRELGMSVRRTVSVALNLAENGRR
jgi:hypothetical protein